MKRLNRIDAKFKELAARKEKALILYMTAGDPSLKKNEELIPELEKQGVDWIELGVLHVVPLFWRVQALKCQNQCKPADVYVF
jgi:tryptophan synthase alpha chain